MGKRDDLTKSYMSDPDRFADIFNCVLFGGKQVIDPANLSPLDPTGIAIIPQADIKNVSSVQKVRDIFKHCVVKQMTGATLVLLGIENQSDIHYAIPVKNILYDVLSYADQVNRIAKKHREEKDKVSKAEFLSGFRKDDRLVPVITLVIYWNIDEWDAPVSLREMFAEESNPFLKFVPDYRINLVTPVGDWDTSVLKTELRNVFDTYRVASDRMKMKELLESRHQEFEHLDTESVQILKEFLGLDIDIPEGVKEVNMCKAFEDNWKAGNIEGIQQGTKETNDRNDRLFGTLAKEGLLQDIVRATSDAAYKETLYKQYGI